MNPAEQGKTGQIINYGRDDDERYLLFDSLEGLLEWLWNAYHSNKVELVTEELQFGKETNFSVAVEIESLEAREYLKRAAYQCYPLA